MASYGPQEPSKAFEGLVGPRRALCGPEGHHEAIKGKMKPEFSTCASAASMRRAAPSSSETNS